MFIKQVKMPKDASYDWPQNMSANSGKKGSGTPKNNFGKGASRWAIGDGGGPINKRTG